jgi:membrane protein YqaA with SNARE-associated domain
VKRVDQVFAVSLVLIFIYWIILMLNLGSASFLSNLFEWITEDAIVLGYPGTFLVSLLGSASVVVEVPFAGVPFVLGGLREGITGPFLFDPWLLGLLSGVGATIGDMTSYALGYLGRRVVDEVNTQGFSKFVNDYPRATPVAVFILASTPLPLDPAVVALGVARYSWWKLFLPCLVGEIVFLTVVSWAGRLSLDWFLGILGIGVPVTITSAAVEVLSILLLVVTVYLAVRLDWTAIAKKLGKADTDQQE